MPNEDSIAATGFIYAATDSTSITGAYNGVRAKLEAAGPIGIIAEVNHGMAAANAGLDLRPTRVIMFGNPKLGTPLMQQNILTKNSVDTIYDRLRAAISGNANLTIVAELDHSANAGRVGLTLPASKLIIFGNPAVGSPFMQGQQSVGIDLPVKMLVYDNGGGTTVAYNAPEWLAARHGIDGNLPQISMMRKALENLTNVALGN